MNTVAIIDRTTSEVVWVLTDGVIGQHTTHMLSDDVPGAGNILVFDNGHVSWSVIPTQYYSRIVEIDPVTKTFPYIYTAESSGLPPWTFFSNFASGVQRLANGNTLIAETRWGRIFEVTDSGQMVWEYIVPYKDSEDSNQIYRAYKEPLEWAGPHFTPDLTLSADDAPEPVPAGGFFDYTIQVENSGLEPAVGVELSGATPVGTVFESISDSAGWDCSTPAVGETGLITCTRSNLSAGSAALLTMVVRVDPCIGEGTTISATAAASSLGTDANPADNTVTVEATGANNPLIPDLTAGLINSRQDVQLEWEDLAPARGYYVSRSTTPDGGFAAVTELLFENNYIDIEAVSSSDDYYYLIDIDCPPAD